MNLYAGTSSYSEKAWKGKFYPKDLPAAEMLRYYGERFRAVEINSTFFAMPKARSWKNGSTRFPPVSASRSKRRGRSHIYSG